MELEAKAAELARALAASEASAEELRRENERLSNLLRTTRDVSLVDMTADRDSWMQQTDMAREDTLLLLERVKAAEASAHRLTEALGKAMAVLDNPPGITFGEMARRNTEAWKILFDARRAALDEAQKVKLK